MHTLKDFIYTTLPQGNEGAKDNYAVQLIVYEHKITFSDLPDCKIQRDFWIFNLSLSLTNKIRMSIMLLVFFSYSMSLMVKKAM